jgi:hypothetical protein
VIWSTAAGFLPEGDFARQMGVFLEIDMATHLLLETARMVKIERGGNGGSEAKTVKLLLGSGEGRFNTVIEALVREVCREQAVVHTTRAVQVGEVIRHGSEQEFDLIILIPDHIRPDYSPQGSPGFAAEAVRAIQAIKSGRGSAVLVFSPGGRHGESFMEAGAEYVLGIPFKCDEVKTVVRRLVPLSPGAESSSAKRRSLGGLLRTNIPLFGRS